VKTANFGAKQGTFEGRS